MRWRCGGRFVGVMRISTSSPRATDLHLQRPATVETPQAEAVPARIMAGSPGGAPEEGAAVDVAVDERLDRMWNVIIWNDPINLMTYVTYVIQRLFGYPLEKATKLMLEVHKDGKSLVASVPREKGEHYVGRLHGFGLQATLEKNS